VLGVGAAAEGALLDANRSDPRDAMLLNDDFPDAVGPEDTDEKGASDTFAGAGGKGAADNFVVAGTAALCADFGIESFSAGAFPPKPLLGADEPSKKAKEGAEDVPAFGLLAQALTGTENKHVTTVSPL
jgi:hypothetical protein